MKIAGRSPSPRWHHTVAVLAPSTLVLFGGFRSSSIRFNDLWLLDTKTDKWSQPQPGMTEEADDGKSELCIVPSWENHEVGCLSLSAALSSYPRGFTVELLVFACVSTLSPALSSYPRGVISQLLVFLLVALITTISLVQFFQFLCKYFSERGYSALSLIIIRIMSVLVFHTCTDIARRNGGLQQTLEGVPRPKGISLWERDRKLAPCVRRVRRTRLQQKRFQRRVCEF